MSRFQKCSCEIAIFVPELHLDRSQPRRRSCKIIFWIARGLGHFLLIFFEDFLDFFKDFLRFCMWFCEISKKSLKISQQNLENIFDEKNSTKKIEKKFLQKSKIDTLGYNISKGERLTPSDGRERSILRQIFFLQKKILGLTHLGTLILKGQISAFPKLVHRWSIKKTDFKWTVLRALPP